VSTRVLKELSAQLAIFYFKMLNSNKNAQPFYPPTFVLTTLLYHLEREIVSMLVQTAHL